ncbi:MAG TPA: hypothetical protein DCL39_08535 [Alteromonas macleodii]|mgnify:CR=1 FL=1|nr:hypothetical protein [Alteromonas macleodii]|tara:strand:+ start:2266 stop:2658 length:393 start_codon:yes stop_codon:yes gene_type:complete
MSYNIKDLLVKEGFISFPVEDDNIIHAEKAFLGYRVIQWIRQRAAEDKNFNLQSYLVALTYYKLGLAHLKFEDNELLYRYTGNITSENDNEYSQINNKSIDQFHRPDQTLNSDGTISGSSYDQEPPQGHE